LKAPNRWALFLLSENGFCGVEASKTDVCCSESLKGTHAEKGEEMRRKKFSLIIILAVVGSLFAGKAATSRAGDPEVPLLRGLKEVFVNVDDLHFTAERLGLTTDHLRKDAEVKLKMAGIKVRSEKESITTPGIPQLHITVRVLGTSSGDYAAHIQVELLEEVGLLRHPGEEVFASTWTSGKFGVTRSLSDVRQQEQELIDKFINEYLAANPPSSPTT
jgi:hypothetical protein